MRDLSIGWKSALVVVALFAVVLLRWSSRGDAKPIDVSDFVAAAPVNDSLRKLVPVGTPVAQAQALMEQSGFECDPRRESTITVDTANGKLGAGPPRLECWRSNKIQMGLKHRDWTVVYDYDTAGVRDVAAGFIIQP